MKPSKIVKAVLFPIGILTILGGVIAGNVVTSNLEDLLNKYLTPLKYDEKELEKILKEGEKIVEQIQDEGTVLLRNEGNTLPLNKNIKKINVFGRTSTDWIYSGSGSGQVMPEKDDSPQYSILESLQAYGVETNSALSSFYKSYQSPLGYGDSLGDTFDQFYVLSEPALSEYPSGLLDSSKEYSDTAFVVISRKAGEAEDATKYQNKLNGKARDNSRTYLEISTEEEEMLRYVGENFDKVVVLINSTNVMELGFLETIPGLDACLYVGPTGNKGALEIPKIIFGDLSPSGKTADTYAYELETSSTFISSSLDGVNYYTNSGDLYPVGLTLNNGVAPKPGVPYLDYKEGIYVGYKWYETADVEGYWDNVDNQYGTKYDGVVQYPFGYGLSYATFSYELKSITLVTPDGESNISATYVLGKDDTLHFNVEVKNVSQVASKDVVELYYSAPYIDGGIEKSAINLVDFAKTKVLQPNESEIVTLEVNVQDMASFDCYDKNNNSFKGYELDAGDYTFKIKADAHHSQDVTYNGALTNGEYSFNLPQPVTYPNDRITGEKVENRFTGNDAVDGASIDGSDTEGAISFFSRANFPETITKDPARAMHETLIKNNLYAGNKIKDSTKADAWDNATKDIYGKAIDNSKFNTTFGARHGMKVANHGEVTELGYELAEDFNSPKWDELLEQTSIKECVKAISSGIYGNVAVDSIGKPELAELDGPIQIKGFRQPEPRSNGYPSTVVLACTWNKELCQEFGRQFAKEINGLGLDGVYGPSSNVHRSPFEGRNYEYYSEDPILTGKLVNRTCLGLKQGGKYGYIKHFGLGESECERDSLYTWMSEQTLRELYFKPFQIAVTVDEAATGFMSSYSRIGSVWAGGSEAALTGLLRGEWQFKGSVVTDWSDHNEYMLMDQALRAGGDLGMSAPLKFKYNNSSSPRIKNQLKLAVKHQTYMFLSVKLANKKYNESVSEEACIITRTSQRGWVWWKPLIVDLTILGISGSIIWTYCLVREFVPIKKRKETQND